MSERLLLLKERLKNQALQNKYRKERQMKISEVQVFKLRDPRGLVKAYANIVVDDALRIKGFKVLEGRDGFFIGMPDKKKPESKQPAPPRQDGKKERMFEDIVYPISREAREELEIAILDEWDRIAGGGYTEEAAQESLQEENSVPVPDVPETKLDNHPRFGRRK